MQLSYKNLELFIDGALGDKLLILFMLIVGWLVMSGEPLANVKLRNNFREDTLLCYTGY